MRAPPDSMKPTTGAPARPARRSTRTIESACCSPSDHPVAGARLLAHPAGAHVGSQQGQRSGIAERLQALDGRELLLDLGNELDRHAASRHSTALWPPKPKAFERPTAGLPSMSRGRALPGT